MFVYLTKSDQYEKLERVKHGIHNQKRSQTDETSLSLLTLVFALPAFGQTTIGEVPGEFDDSSPTCGLLSVNTAAFTVEFPDNLAFIVDVSRFPKADQRARATLVEVRRGMMEWVKSYVDQMEVQWGLAPGSGEIVEPLDSAYHNCEVVLAPGPTPGTVIVTDCAGTCGGCTCIRVRANRRIG